MNKIVNFFIGLTKPISQDEDKARQESILNILLLSSIVFILLAIVSYLVKFSTASAEDIKNNALSLTAIACVAVFLYVLLFISRKSYFKLSAFLFLSAFFILASYMGYRWGVNLPAEIFLYVLVIIMAGILLGTRIAFMSTFIICSTIAVIGYLQIVGKITANRYWTSQSWEIPEIAVASIIFIIIATVSWLSNREIEKSLKRARKSEAELQEERDLLEVKVEERTKELKKLEAEKIMHLYRFAEFGRLSAGLFHDLINPLNAVSLSIEKLKVNDDSVNKAMTAAKKMEDLVVAVRKQISRQDNKNIFSLTKEIQDVIDVLSYKARKNNVEIRFLHESDISFLGNAIRFNQAALNLIANAIDSYPAGKSDNARERTVEVLLGEKSNEIILSVKDLGAGISRENLQNIFEPFFTTKDYGVGIGLSMAKQIVERDFYGKLIVESSTEASKSGSIFTVAIPKNNEC